MHLLSSYSSLVMIDSACNPAPESRYWNFMSCIARTYIIICWLSFIFLCDVLNQSFILLCRIVLQYFDLASFFIIDFYYYCLGILMRERWCMNEALVNPKKTFLSFRFFNHLHRPPIQEPISKFEDADDSIRTTEIIVIASVNHSFVPDWSLSKHVQSCSLRSVNRPCNASLSILHPVQCIHSLPIMLRFLAGLSILFSLQTLPGRFCWKDRKQ